MTREEARVIAYGDREVIVEVLLQLSATIDQLKARVAELERQVAMLTKDSSNSSKPPSSDGPGTNPKTQAPKKSSKKKRGGQPGHKGSNRKLVPVEDVNLIYQIYPDKCDHCGADFTKRDAECRITRKHWRRQVIDIPEPKPEVTEYQLICTQCSCGSETWAKAPEVAKTGFGPRITALFAHLTGLHRVTRRGCREIAKTIFDIDISVGAVCNLHQEVAEALEPAYDEIKKVLPKQPSLNIDETGWKNQGKKHWLWVLNTPKIAFYHVDSSRGSKVLESILGPVYNGIICSDMFSAYKKYHKNGHQFCWSHIIRSIKGVKHSCRSPDGLNFSKYLLAQIGQMFGVWRGLRNGYLDRMSFVLKSTIVRFRMRMCLEKYVKSPDKDVRKISKSLLKNWHGLFTFLKYMQVQPTNNSAERALRPAVQWRKICFGNQSDHGLFLTERLLTITRTCILQNKNPFQFIIKSIISYRCGTKAPSIA